ncbi:MAG: hypothetical protein MSIBF_01535 [Candidatus Altiarchaeales archaeon IMC4]|nr:MAG: hypothetical protein MSIBF_01535 [Candidatus Altiarchaeales archaeon IMC4]
MESMIIKTSPILMDELDYVVDKEHYRSKSDAINDAIRFFIKKHKLSMVDWKIERIREGTEGLPSLTEAVVESHEEEDERL